MDFQKYGINLSPRENIKKIKELSLEFINNLENPNQKNCHKKSKRQATEAFPQRKQFIDKQILHNHAYSAAKLQNK